MNGTRTRRDLTERPHPSWRRGTRELDAPPHWYVAAARLRCRLARQLEAISTSATPTQHERNR